MPGEVSWRERYEAHRSAGAAALKEGRLECALACFQSALEEARRGDDPVLVDRAVCNRAAVAIELGQHREAIPDLREILMASRDPETSFLAASHVARAYEHDKAFRKAVFYARIACDRGRWLDDPRRLSLPNNWLGNALVALGHLDEAAERYREALELTASEGFRRAVILDNLGYCRVLQGAHRDGFRLLYESLRTFRRVGARYALVHLDLAHAHLEIDRPRRALRHALQGLRLAETSGLADQVKNGLYLAGEAIYLLGDESSARKFFERLEPFFPESPHLTQFLLSVDVRRMINLRA